MRHAWAGGLRFLADSLASLLSVLVGGLVWWALLIAGVLIVRHYVRAAERRRAATPT